MHLYKKILNICFILTLLLLASCNNEAQIPAKIVSFEEAFQFKKKIYLDERVKLKSIQSLHADTNGNLLLFDLFSNQVVLVDKDGRLIKNITPESCHPGHNWKPKAANFNDKGQILIITSTGEIYWFSSLGECIVRSASTNNSPGGHLTFDDRGDFYFRPLIPIETYVQRSDSLGKLRMKFKVENSLPTYTGFAGIAPIASDGQNIWIPLTHFDGFYVYSKEGKKLKTVKYASPSFKSPQKDLSTRDTDKLIKNIGEISSLVSFLKTKSGAVSIYIHRHNLLNNRDKQIGISIFDEYQNNMRYILTDERGSFIGNNGNNLFYTSFIPTKVDTAQCKKCGTNTTMGLNEYQLR